MRSTWSSHACWAFTGALLRLTAMRIFLWTQKYFMDDKVSYLDDGMDGYRYFLVSIRKFLCVQVNNDILERWFCQLQCLVHRRLWMVCGNHRGSHGHGYPQILKYRKSDKFKLQISLYSPFKDLIYDCQNLAFLFGVSLKPIMARCCLNILLLFCGFLASNKK